MEPLVNSDPDQNGTRHPLRDVKGVRLRTYVVSLTLCLLLYLGLAAIVVDRNIQDVRSALVQYGQSYSEHLNKAAISTQTVLEGFSALFAAVGSTDPEVARRYVRQIITANPQIFSLEIVQRVDQERLAEFISEGRRRIRAGFDVRAYSYGTERKWREPEVKPVYYPIAFAEPMQSEEILGLDVDSVPFLRRAMLESLRKRVPVASQPFRLVEGNLGYVIFYPIQYPAQSSDEPATLAPPGGQIVDLVVDATKLTEAANLPMLAKAGVVVHHNNFQPDDPQGQLLYMPPPVPNALEATFLPSFSYVKSLSVQGAPFDLRVVRQVGLSDLSLQVLALIAGLALLSSLTIVACLRVTERSRLVQARSQGQLWYLANHDPLTGLANRSLLMDRLGQLLPRMSRHKRQFALLYLDIDDFKQINDTYGHDVGDQLIKFVADCLRASVRVEDTVARMSGDEFIILLEDMQGNTTPEAVRNALLKRLSGGFVVAGHSIGVAMSIGVALFPQDGDCPEELIKRADKRMYREKRQHHAQQSFLGPRSVVTSATDC